MAYLPLMGPGEIGTWTKKWLEQMFPELLDRRVQNEQMDHEQFCPAHVSPVQKGFE